MYARICKTLDLLGPKGGTQTPHQLRFTHFAYENMYPTRPLAPLSILDLLLVLYQSSCHCHCCHSCLCHCCHWWHWCCSQKLNILLTFCRTVNVWWENRTVCYFMFQEFHMYTYSSVPQLLSGFHPGLVCGQPRFKSSQGYDVGQVI